VVCGAGARWSCCWVGFVVLFCIWGGGGAKGLEALVAGLEENRGLSFSSSSPKSKAGYGLLFKFWGGGGGTDEEGG